MGSENEEPSPAIVGDVAGATFPLWFPFFRFLTRHLSPVVLARLGAATVERIIWARESVREAVLDNYACVLGLPRESRRVEETAKEMLSTHSRLWIDLLRYSGQGGLDSLGLIAKRRGDGMLVEAQKEGKGAILLTAHVGNFELGGLFLKGMGIEVSAVYAPDPSPVVEEHRATARRLIGVEGIPVTRSPFAFVPILRALRENRFVAMQGDRDVSGTGVRLPFFGRTAAFPVGPFRLAAISGAPIFPVFILQEADGRYETRVESPYRIPKGSGEAAAIEGAMGTFVALLERTIRERPSQWILFTRFWE
jgi:lauroyl/myristoyl acyltransferase